MYAFVAKAVSPAVGPCNWGLATSAEACSVGVQLGWWILPLGPALAVGSHAEACQVAMQPGLVGAAHR